MNQYYIKAVQHQCLVKPDANFFIYHHNQAYTSKRTKSNRVNAYLLCKLVMMLKYDEQIIDVVMLLLKTLTQQYFYINYYGDHELKDDILYYNEIVSHNIKLYDIFTYPNTPHKIKFMFWLRKLCHSDEDTIIQLIESKSYDTEYLNTKEYTIMQSLVCRQQCDFNQLQNGKLVLAFISMLPIDEQYDVLKQQKDNYIDDSYLIKKKYLVESISRNVEITLSELNRYANIDIDDSEYQWHVISLYLKYKQNTLAMQQLYNHLLNAQGTSEIWELFTQLLHNYKSSITTDVLDLSIITQLHFGYEFMIAFDDDNILVQNKLAALFLLDPQLYEEYMNVL